MITNPTTEAQLQAVHPHLLHDTLVTKAIDIEKMEGWQRRDEQEHDIVSVCTIMMRAWRFVCERTRKIPGWEERDGSTNAKARSLHYCTILRKCAAEHWVYEYTTRDSRIG